MTRRRNVLGALLFAGAALSASIRAQAPGAGRAPRLEVEQDFVDIGQVVRGSEAKVIFVIRNTGTDVLKILSAKPG